jgi:hypothetical protein
MTPIAAIAHQLQVARTFSRMALKGLREADWDEIAPALRTDINWQFGHMLIGNYHFGVELISGPQAGLLDLPTYARCYHRGTSPLENRDSRPGKADLLAAAARVDAAMDAALAGLDEAGLAAPVATFQPMITTKHAALLFCGTHQMYHNGQMALVRKALAAG